MSSLHPWLIGAVFAGLLALASAQPAVAVDNIPPLQNARLQQRYLALTHELRCMQCQNETLADSPVSLAADLRREVRDLLVQGDSDQQIRDHMVARYGNFILFRPPMNWRTAWLWGAPAALMILGALVGWRVVRARHRLVDQDDSPLPDETQS